MSIHVIRLRGPWQYEPLSRSVRLAAGILVESNDGLPPPGRVEVPCDWAGALGPEYRGRVRYRRSFSCPTGLDEHHRVYLVVEGVRSEAAVVLNGRPLGALRGRREPGRYDVTALLRPRNEVVIDVYQPGAGGKDELSKGEDPDLPGGLVGEVYLEIHSQPEAPRGKSP